MTVDIDKWVTEPWELVGMDLIGKLRTTTDGNQYICTIDRLFYKMVYCIPVKNQICIQSCAVHN